MSSFTDTEIALQRARRIIYKEIETVLAFANIRGEDGRFSPYQSLAREATDAALRELTWHSGLRIELK